MRIVVVLLFVAACAPGPGAPCERRGDGFTGFDSCRIGGADGRCVSFPVTCPDGCTVDAPFVCDGPACDDDDDCDKGFVCAGTGSATTTCVPATVCVVDAG